MPVPSGGSRPIDRAEEKNKRVDRWYSGEGVCFCLNSVPRTCIKKKNGRYDVACLEFQN